jgi:hypothetical protein
VVRASWGAGATPDTLDLEVQVSASSVGQLQNLEVAVASEWPSGEDDELASWAYSAEPRDVRSAALSYDGREPDDFLRRLTTRPVASAFEPRFSPRVFSAPAADGMACYVEMVQPDDAARRITGEPVGPTAGERRPLSTRYALFGHDLEKGVVLRARLRGIWLATPPEAERLAAIYREFREEGLPLGP